MSQAPSGPEAVPPKRIGRYELLTDPIDDGVVSVCIARVRGPAVGPRLVELAHVDSLLAREVEFREAFLAEARAAGRIRHMSFVYPADTLVHDGELYAATELVHGAKLGALFRGARARGYRISLPVTARIILDLLAALASVHETAASGAGVRSLIHGDVTPDTVVVTHLGLTRLVHSGLGMATRRLDASGAKSQRLGYKAPEQLCSGIDAVPLDPTTDLFSVAAILWEGLAGVPVFDGPTDRDTVERILKGAPTSMYAADGTQVPKALVALAQAGLRVHGEGTIESATEFAGKLERALGGVIGSAEDVAAVVELLAGEAMNARRKFLEERIAAADRLSPPSGSHSQAPAANGSDLASRPRSGPPRSPLPPLPETGGPVSLPAGRRFSSYPPPEGNDGFVRRTVAYVGGAMLITAAAFLLTRPSIGPAPAVATVTLGAVDGQPTPTMTAAPLPPPTALPPSAPSASSAPAPAASSPRGGPNANPAIRREIARPTGPMPTPSPTPAPSTPPPKRVRPDIPPSI